MALVRVTWVYRLRGTSRGDSRCPWALLILGREARPPSRRVPTSDLNGRTMTYGSALVGFKEALSVCVNAQTWRGCMHLSHF